MNAAVSHPGEQTGADTSRMRYQQRAVGSGVAALLLFGGCAAESSQLESTRLPLQDEGLKIGGDVQSRSTDVIETRITEEQAREIADACNEAVEIAGTGQDDCRDVMQFVSDGGGNCTPFEMCIRVYEVDDLSGFTGNGIIEIDDPRETGSLCDDNPSRVCLRVGIETVEVVDELMAHEPSTPSSGATTAKTTQTTSTSTSTETATSTATATATPSDPTSTTTTP